MSLTDQHAYCRRSTDRQNLWVTPTDRHGSPKEIFVKIYRSAGSLYEINSSLSAVNRSENFHDFYDQRISSFVAAVQQIINIYENIKGLLNKEQKSSTRQFFKNFISARKM